MGLEPLTRDTDPRADAARCHAMEEIARDLFWVMAKDSVGQDAWVANGVGLRTGWTLVTGPRRVYT